MAESSVFEKYSRFYDLLYRDKDYRAESDYIASLLLRNGLSAGTILEFGSGTGRHGVLLAEKGYTVFGIERSPSMVARAPKSTGFCCCQGNILTLDLGRRFDAVLALFHVLSYQPTNDEVRAFFTSASRHLKSEGLFIFDFWYSPAVHYLKPTTRVERAHDGEFSVTRIAEPAVSINHNIVNVEYTVFVETCADSRIECFSETHVMRHFSLPELAFICEQAGFSIVEYEEFLTGRQPGEGTWGVCLVLRKEGIE